MKQRENRSSCPVNLALEVFGDRWTLLVVRDVLLRGPSTFGDFLASAEGIATNILANRLETLTSAGILAKRDVEGRSRHVYALTDKGLDLMPVLFAIVLWSDKHFEVSVRGRELARRYREEPEAVTAELRERHATTPVGGRLS